MLITKDRCEKIISLWPIGSAFRPIDLLQVSCVRYAIVPWIPDYAARVHIREMLLIPEHRDEHFALGVCRGASRQAKREAAGDLLQVPATCRPVIPRIPQNAVIIAIGEMLLVIEHGNGIHPVRDWGTIRPPAAVDLLQIPSHLVFLADI